MRSKVSSISSPLTCVLWVCALKSACARVFGFSLTYSPQSLFCFILISSPIFLFFCALPAEEASTAAIWELRHVLWRWRQQRRVQRVFWKVLQLTERRGHSHVHEADRRCGRGLSQQKIMLYICLLFIAGVQQITRYRWSPLSSRLYFFQYYGCFKAVKSLTANFIYFSHSFLFCLTSQSKKTFIKKRSPGL